jgi:hypothetical protein
MLAHTKRPDGSLGICKFAPVVRNALFAGGYTRLHDPES